MMSTGHDGDVHISVFCDVIRYPSGCIPQSVVPPSSRRCGRLRAGSLPARARKALLASDHSSIERTPFFLGPTFVLARFISSMLTELGAFSTTAKRLVVDRKSTRL